MGRVVLTASVLMASGCATLLGYPADPPSEEEIAAVAAEIAALPNSAESELTMRAVVEQVAAAASAIAPDLRWSWSGERKEGPCAGLYATTGGIGVTLPRYVAEGSVAESEWPGLQETARGLAATVDAVDMLPGSNPPHHHVNFESFGGGEWGHRTELAIYSSPGSMTITASTGCRMP